MPLALSDDQLATIRQFAEPLHPNDRGRFLQRVAHLLQGCERDVGRIEQVCKMLKTCSREEVGRFDQSPLCCRCAWGLPRSR